MMLQRYTSQRYNSMNKKTCHIFAVLRPMWCRGKADWLENVCGHMQTTWATEMVVNMWDILVIACMTEFCHLWKTCWCHMAIAVH